MNQSALSWAVLCSSFTLTVKDLQAESKFSEVHITNSGKYSENWFIITTKSMKMDIVFLNIDPRKRIWACRFG